MNDYGGSSDVGATGQETCAYVRGNQMLVNPIDGNWSYNSYGGIGSGFEDESGGGGGGVGSEDYSSFWSGILDIFSNDENGNSNGIIIDKFGKILSNGTSLFNGVFLKSDIFDQYKFIGTMGGIIDGNQLIGNLIYAHKLEIENGRHTLNLFTFTI